MLRPYQQAAFDGAVNYIKKCFDPCLIEAATGAGKSHIIAAIAEWVNTTSGKKVLCLAPSKELVLQNHAKYLATGNPASIYCASISKSLAHDVVFGSPTSVLNSLEKFGDNFSCIIIDEAHGITPTVKAIVEHMRQQNHKCRVIGCTATPYRLGDGFIYEYDVDNKPVPETKTKNPYFKRLVYKITAGELIDMGFLTRPHADPVSESYDTSGIENHTAKEYEQVFEGKGRKTSLIVQDVVNNSYGRMGVMIFAATVQHAEEVMESLDPNNSRLITGKTKKADRALYLQQFQSKQFKYLVNVSVLTTGFDATHVDVVAILRATDSVGLLQQIIGRGLRLDDNKFDCLVLDYAGNIERHCPDGDIFNPKIEARYKSSESFNLEAKCPSCDTINEFKGRDNPDRFEYDENGYFLDLLGQHIIVDEKPMPAHHGRRCYGQQLNAGYNERCEYRWTFKQCLECDHENDIAARYCESCKAELIDPNEKLQLEFLKMKADPYTASTDKVISWNCQEWTSKAGNQTLRVDYSTEYASFTIWYNPASNNARARYQWQDFVKASGGTANNVERFMELHSAFETTMPETITVKKDKASKFYTVIAHNRPADEAPN
jgi:DNA repair protein RadD